MRAIEISAEGLEDLAEYVNALPERAERAAARAVNRAADYARTLGADEMYAQINFPGGYLAPGKGRLTVTRRAKGGDLEAVVTGRDRATSLARFGVGNKKVGRRKPGNPVRVQVKTAGGVETLDRGFYLRLRAGKTLDDENFNLGLAVRLKKGERLANKRDAILIASGLYLLYAPSVGQVFSTVAEDIQPKVLEKLEDEFLRQLNLED